MTDRPPNNPVARFFARPNEDPVKTVGMALIVALLAALLVSVASIVLQPAQDVHIAAERQARMDAMLDTLPGLRGLMEETGVTALETRVVNLDTGEFAPDIDAASYDFTAAARDPDASIALPEGTDIAGLGRRATHAPIYLLERDGELMLIVLPVSGTGYQSTIRAMLALQSDLNTVAALSIMEQGETPGLGARIEDPAWQALWPGKEIADDTGAIVIDVVRGSATGPHQVDGLSGATRTVNGVTNMVRFWMGDHGFGPFLDRLATEGLQ